MLAQKYVLRKTIAEKKKSLFSDTFPQERTRQSELIRNKIEGFDLFKRASVILLFASLPDEPDTTTWINIWNINKTVLLPRMSGDDLVLHRFTEWNNIKTEPKFGIREPEGPVWSSLPEVDMAIVPGVAFDKQFNRLGRGKGYYDRLLPLLTKAYKVGVCFDFQIVESVPTEDGDIPMDRVFYP